MEQETKSCKPAGCPFGCSTANPDMIQNLELQDVKEGQQIKRYSDSQFMSFYSNNLHLTSQKRVPDDKSPISMFGDRVK